MTEIFQQKIISDGILGITKSDKLQFLKFNTPGSINGLYAKVIFLVFKNDDRQPCLCIKTVRKATDNHLIENGFKNLQNLNSITKDRQIGIRFPKAFVIEYYSGIAYSIEEALFGRSATHNDLDFIIKSYTLFQKDITQNSLVKSRYSDNIKEICKQFGPDISVKLESFSQTLTGYDIDIVNIPQHGDVTFDNMYIESGGDLCLIDCEEFGVYKVAGFDLYHLLRRDGYITYSTQKGYLDGFLANISAKPSNPAYIFLVYLSDIIRKYPLYKDKITAEETISDFQNSLL